MRTFEFHDPSERYDAAMEWAGETSVDPDPFERMRERVLRMTTLLGLLSERLQDLTTQVNELSKQLNQLEGDGR